MNEKKIIILFRFFVLRKIMKLHAIIYQTIVWLFNGKTLNYNLRQFSYYRIMKTRQKLKQNRQELAETMYGKKFTFNDKKRHILII